MSRLGSIYIKLGEPDGEMPGCCETADWAAGYIEELQSELNEQCRLLGMSAERELALNTQIQKLITERNAFGLAIDRAISGIVPDEHPLRSRLVEVAALRAEIERQTARYALLEESYNLLRAEIETMRKQEPVLLWHVTDNEDEEDIFPVTEHNLQCPACRPLYLAPGAQDNNDERT